MRWSGPAQRSGEVRNQRATSAAARGTPPPAARRATPTLPAAATGVRLGNTAGRTDETATRGDLGTWYVGTPDGLTRIAPWITTRPYIAGWSSRSSVKSPSDDQPLNGQSCRPRRGRRLTRRHPTIRTGASRHGVTCTFGALIGRTTWQDTTHTNASLHDSGCHVAYIDSSPCNTDSPNSCTAMRRMTPSDDRHHRPNALHQWPASEIDDS